MGGCDWLFNFIADECLVVALPRRLVIRNRRLGLLYKVLQVAFLIAAVLYAVYSEVFFKHNVVKEWGVNMWHMENPVQAAATGARIGPNCENPAVYEYKRDLMFSYTPSSCKVLPDAESNRMLGNQLFVPTFHDEESVWDKCGANVSEVCNGYNSKAVYTNANGRCACILNEQFLVQNADEQHIRFVYGYEADVSGGERSDLRYGGIVSSMASKGAPHQMEGQKSNLVTQFLSLDGSECSFGGRSLWKHSDAVGGLTGTLNELLSCAGITLDSDPATLVAGTFVGPPHLRTMGFKLQLHLLIVEDALFHLKCEVRVVATPAATALWDNNARPSVIPEIGASTRRTQRIHGVVITVHMTGSIKTFSWNQVIRGFVDISVVLALPGVIIQFVAMYLMGLVSQVYRQTARTKLNIFAKFHNTMAKVMIAEVAFRGIVGKFDGHTKDLISLSPRMLFKRLHDIFEDALGKEELVKMASVIFTSMDANRSGEISCSEFIRACTDDGEISLERMAHFFDANQPKQVMRRLFDNTHSESQEVARLSMSKFNFSRSRMGTPTFEQSMEFSDLERSFKSTSLESGSCPPDIGIDVLAAHESKYRKQIQELEQDCERARWDGSTAEAEMQFGDVSDIMEDTLVDTPEEMKDVSPSIIAPHDTNNISATHENTFVRLEKRMQELELHCERAQKSTSVMLEKRTQELELRCERALHALRVSVLADESLHDDSAGKAHCSPHCDKRGVTSIRLTSTGLITTGDEIAAAWLCKDTCVDDQQNFDTLKADAVAGIDAAGSKREGSYRNWPEYALMMRDLEEAISRFWENLEAKAAALSLAAAQRALQGEPALAAKHWQPHQPPSFAHNTLLETQIAATVASGFAEAADVTVMAKAGVGLPLNKAAIRAAGAAHSRTDEQVAGSSKCLDGSSSDVARLSSNIWMATPRRSSSGKLSPVGRMGRLLPNHCLARASSEPLQARAGNCLAKQLLATSRHVDSHERANILGKLRHVAV